MKNAPNKFEMHGKQYKLQIDPIVIEIIIRTSHENNAQRRQNGIEVTKFRIICSENNIQSVLAIEVRMTLYIR